MNHIRISGTGVNGKLVYDHTRFFKENGDSKSELKFSGSLTPEHTYMLKPGVQDLFEAILGI